MFCPNCGNQFEGTSFCPACGSKVEQEATDMQQNMQQNVQQPQQFQPVQQNAPIMPPQGAPESFQPMAQQPQKKNMKKILLISIPAVVVAIALVVGVVFAVFASNPRVAVLTALEKTLFEATDYSFELNYDDGYGDISIEGSVAYGERLSNSSFYVTFNDGYTNTEVVSNQGKVLACWQYDDYDEEKYKLFIAADDIYNELIESPDKLDEYPFDEVIEMFDSNFCIEQEQLVSLATNIISGNKINEAAIEELYNTSGRELLSDAMDEKEEDIPDYDTLRNLLADFVAKGISKEAVIVEKGDKTNGVTYYDITINASLLLSDLGAFLTDSKDAEAFLATDAGDDLLEAIEESAEWYEDEDEIELQVGISGGFLTEVYYENSEWDYEVEIILSEVNKGATDYEALYAEIEDESKKAEQSLEIEDTKDIERVFS